MLLNKKPCSFSVVSSTPQSVEGKSPPYVEEVC